MLSERYNAQDAGWFHALENKFDKYSSPWNLSMVGAFMARIWPLRPFRESWLTDKRDLRLEDE
jgi:hypothetical protein